MATFPSQPDVVVIGAGAAGIGAGRALLDRGVTILILEARDRIGGRAWTVPYEGTAPLDLGCEWLHSADRNILAALAPDFGFALDRSEPPWRRPVDQASFPPADQAAFAMAQAAFETRVAEAARAARDHGRDHSAADCLDRDGRWNGLLDAISTYYNGAPLARVSVVDYDAYVDTEVNWRVSGGYGALLGAMAADLPVKSRCAVQAVDGTGRRVRIATAEGTIEAKRVIVTVPTNVLAAGTIAFTPACDDQLAAAAALPLGLADKLFFALDRPDAFEPDTRVIGATDVADTGSYTLRPRGRPMIEGYFGGDFARALELGGLDAFVETARGELAQALGHDVLRQLTPVLATGWAHDPWALGSYSHALPGHADARAVLARPVDDRIVFAGEATSPHFFSTAHGAFEAGRAAGEAMAQSIRKHDRPARSR